MIDNGRPTQLTAALGESISYVCDCGNYTFDDQGNVLTDQTVKCLETGKFEPIQDCSSGM